MTERATRAGSDHAGGILVENAEVALRVFRHVGHVDRPAHEGGPGLFGDRLEGRKVPELPLVHHDGGHLVVEHPGPQHGQPAVLRVGEHLVGQHFFHGTWLLVGRRPAYPATSTQVALGPSLTRTTRPVNSGMMTRRPRPADGGNSDARSYVLSMSR